jgi:hypothetical protein
MPQSKGPVFVDVWPGRAVAAGPDAARIFTFARFSVNARGLFIFCFQGDIGFTERQTRRQMNKPKEHTMKKIILATIIAMSAGTAAFASGGVSTAIAIEVNRLVPGADLTNLTTSQISRLHTLFSKAENLRSGENPAGQIQVILGAQ